VPFDVVKALMVLREHVRAYKHPVDDTWYSELEFYAWCCMNTLEFAGLYLKKVIAAR
jgi:hypothetical protein